MIKDHILPLGTVVKVKKGVQELMIIGRAQLYNSGGTIGYFDYAAVLYPQGIISNSQFLFFNDEDVEEVVFEGYRNEAEIAFAESYEESVGKSTYKKMKVESA